MEVVTERSLACVRVEGSSTPRSRGRYRFRVGDTHRHNRATLFLVGMRIFSFLMGGEAEGLINYR